MRSLIVIFSLVVVALSALAVEQAAAEEAAADVEPVATSAPMAGTAPTAEEFDRHRMAVMFGGAASLGYDVRIARTFAAGPRLETLFVDVGDGVTALATSLMFTFTF